MKKALTFFCSLLIGSGVFFSCQDEQNVDPLAVSDGVRSQLISLGFDVFNQAPIKFNQGYLVEGDIYLTPADLRSMKQASKLPVLEQYSTDKLVTASTVRTFTMYAQQGTCTTCYSAGMIAGLDEAIRRYNVENLNIKFSRVTVASGANIVMTRLKKGEEAQGILGSSGFPTGGNPYPEIKMSGVLESKYNLTTGGIATIIAHEMGHCVGFRHTDYYDRSISCGGSPTNEGASTVGANLIPGTLSTATAAAKSWMLACTDGGDRPFNADDKTALNYLY